MSQNSVVIVGVGMMTAIGLTAVETAANVRARTARFSDSSFKDRNSEPFTLAEVPEGALPRISEGLTALPRISGRERRMLRLATMPLRECLAPLAKRSGRIGLCLALPEYEPGNRLERRMFLDYLATQTESAFDPLGSDSAHVGRAGGFVAIGQAVLTLQSGRAKFIVAGGIDTYRDPLTLGMLDREKRLKTTSNLDGFIPGEGAGFLLLATSLAAAEMDLECLAKVSPVSTAFETGHLYSAEPYRGDGLATTLQKVVTEAEAPIREVYSSMTGENHWAKEWGVAFLRTRSAFQDEHGMHHPADCFGDIGAAVGPILVGLAALGIKHGYRRSPALAYGSSDRGARAAVIVRS